jgi:hypothetical protein
MPLFRQRPLMWLFWTATACWNLAALAVHQDSVWFDAVAFGQIAVASGWLTLGKTHRLGRASLLIASLAASVAPDVVRTYDNEFLPVWRHVLGSLILLAAATSSLTACWVIFESATSTASRTARKIGQFPLAEIFGWTTVVAIVIVMTRAALFSHVDQENAVAAFSICAALAGIMAGLLLPWGERLIPQLLVAATIIAGLGAATNYLASPWAACGFVLTWALIQRFERAPAESPKRVEVEASASPTAMSQQN